MLWGHRGSQGVVLASGLVTLQDAGAQSLYLCAVESCLIVREWLRGRLSPGQREGAETI